MRLGKVTPTFTGATYGTHSLCTKAMLSLGQNLDRQFSATSYLPKSRAHARARQTGPTRSGLPQRRKLDNGLGGYTRPLFDVFALAAILDAQDFGG